MRGRILALTETHLMRHGYHGFSFRDLARELEIRPPAVHYHFRTKPELVVASVHRYGHRFDAWVDGVANRTPAEQLLAYVALGQSVVGEGRTCALGMLQAEASTLPQTVCDAVASVHPRFLAFYTDRLQRAREDGDAAFAVEPMLAAELLGCTLVGAQHLARTQGPSAYRRVMGLQTRQLGLTAPWPDPPMPTAVVEDWRS